MKHPFILLLAIKKAELHIILYIIQYIKYILIKRVFFIIFDFIILLFYIKPIIIKKNSKIGNDIIGRMSYSEKVNNLK